MLEERELGQPYTENGERVIYDRALPFFAQQVIDLGFEMPRPYGAQTIVYWQEQDLIPDKLSASAKRFEAPRKLDRFQIHDRRVLNRVGSGNEHSFPSTEINLCFWGESRNTLKRLASRAHEIARASISGSNLLVFFVIQCARSAPCSANSRSLNVEKVSTD